MSLKLCFQACLFEKGVLETLISWLNPIYSFVLILVGGWGHINTTWGMFPSFSNYFFKFFQEGPNVKNFAFGYKLLMLKVFHRALKNFHSAYGGAFKLEALKFHWGLNPKFFTRNHQLPMLKVDAWVQKNLCSTYYYASKLEAQKIRSSNRGKCKFLCIQPLLNLCGSAEVKNALSLLWIP